MRNEFRKQIRAQCLLGDATLVDVACVLGWRYGKLQRKLSGLLELTAEERAEIRLAVAKATVKPAEDPGA